MDQPAPKGLVYLDFGINGNIRGHVFGQEETERFSLAILSFVQTRKKINRIQDKGCNRE